MKKKENKMYMQYFYFILKCHRIYTNMKKKMKKNKN